MIEVFGWTPGQILEMSLRDLIAAGLAAAARMKARRRMQAHYIAAIYNQRLDTLALVAKALGFKGQLPKAITADELTAPAPAASGDGLRAYQDRERDRARRNVERFKTWSAEKVARFCRSRRGKNRTYLAEAVSSAGADWSEADMVNLNAARAALAL